MQKKADGTRITQQDLSHKNLIKEIKEMEPNTVLTSDRLRGNRHTLKHRKVHLEILYSFHFIKTPHLFMVQGAQALEEVTQCRG